MAQKIKRELYSFNIEIEDEVEKEIVKEVEKKNEETGETEKVEEKVIRTQKVKTPVRIILKKPTRTQIEDGDMFYSIWLNKFIKMGLLTRAMLAKKQVDIGGALNDDDKLEYAKLYLKLFEKQQNIVRYSAKEEEDLSNDEKERLEASVSELAVIRKQLSDFEAAQSSVFDHTADVKARNKTITWFLLHLAYYIKGEEEQDAEEAPLFSGTEYEEKYRSFQEADENQEEIFVKAIDKLSTIATIWYMSGVQTQDEFESVLEQIEKDNIVEGIGEEEVEKPAEKAPEEKKEAAKASKPRGRPKKAAK